MFTSLLSGAAYRARTSINIRGHKGVGVGPVCGGKRLPVSD